MTVTTFGELLPDTILDAVTRQGFRPTGALLPLNSYENRVYEIALDDAAPIVAKFYRPGRWSQAAIAAEHRFLARLLELEVPVVVPLTLPHPLADVPTLARSGEILYACSPRFRGRARDEMSNDDRRALGHVLARLHNVGEHFVATDRLRLTPQTYGHDSLSFILSQAFLPADLKQHIEAHLRQALQLVAPWFPAEMPTIVVQGDCHLGNILWDATGPHLLDFDDMVIAPAVQDVWMLFHGSAEEQRAQRKAFFDGYELFRPFDHATLILAEPLRTLRMIRHAAWIGQRYGEPAFQRAFPYYEQRRYWEEFLLGIKEQIALLQELQWG